MEEIEGLDLISLIHHSVSEIVHSYGISGKLSIFALDQRFTDPTKVEFVTENNDDSAYEAWWFYTLIFSELDQREKDLIRITDSVELGEEPEHGDYYYYTGFLSSDIAFLYMQSSHPWVIPCRLIIYDPIFTMEVHSDQKDIDLYQTVPHIRDLFFIPKPFMQEEVKRMLKNSDRPRLDG